MHILYQELRDDVTGIERVGLMYAHGKEWLPSWSFQYSVGDYASNAQLEVYQQNGRDVLAATWVEGFGGESKIAYVITDNSWSADEPEYMVAAGVTNLVMSSYGDKISLIYDEINVYGPMTRYGVLDRENNEFALSNLITEGFTMGYATTKEESITLVSSSSGTLSFKTIVSLEADEINAKEKTFLETLLEPLPGDETTKALIFGSTLVIVAVIFLYLVVSLRRSNREEEEEILSASIVLSEDDVEIMVEIEADDAAIAINLDAEELVVQSVVAPKVAIVEEPEVTLEQSLAAKAESGEGNSRLERRMKRKQQRELVELTEQMISNVPQPPSIDLPPIDAEVQPTDLPALPPVDGAPLPPLPMPGMTVPQKEAKCVECSAKFTIKDLRLTKVKCPICDAVVQL